jgi:hypothetical protein
MRAVHGSAWGRTTPFEMPYLFGSDSGLTRWQLQYRFTAAAAVAFPPLLAIAAEAQKLCDGEATPADLRAALKRFMEVMP